MLIFLSAGKVSIDYLQASCLRKIWSILQNETGGEVSGKNGQILHPWLINTLKKTNWCMHSRSCLVEVFRAVQSSRLRAPALISQMLCCEGDMEFYPSSTFMSVLCLKCIHFLICALASRELLEHCKKLETKSALGMFRGTALTAPQL